MLPLEISKSLNLAMSAFLLLNLCDIFKIDSFKISTKYYFTGGKMAVPKCFVWHSLLSLPHNPEAKYFKYGCLKW